MDGFNKSTRKQTCCSYCNESICRGCLQQFLLMDTAADPVCPSCRAAWSYEFITDQLTASFRNNAYKAHREKVLLDRERARLPETQEDAARYKAAREYVAPINEEMKKHRAAMYETPEYNAYKAAKEERKKYTYNGNMIEWHKMREKLEELERASHKAAMPYKRKINKLSTEEYCRQTNVVQNWGKPSHRVIRAAAAGGGAGGDDAEPTKERKQFVAKCPAPECEGFLSTAWKCGLCNLHTCKDCRELKDENHVCNPETVESVRTILKDSKPCPKCGTVISKISGCDQMWCIDCKTAFSWNTGKIETTVIHNPHYFDWMRKNGGLPQNPVQRGCDNDTIHDIYYTLQRLGRVNQLHSDPLFAKLMDCVRNVQHVRAHCYDYDDTDAVLHMHRVQRLVRDIDDDAWKVKLQRKEKERHKMRAKRQLADAYVQAGTDIFRQLVNAHQKEDIERVMGEFNQLHAYVKEEDAKLARKYKCQGLGILQ